jgi:hypothetical protein
MFNYHESHKIGNKEDNNLDFITTVNSSDLCTICQNDGDLLICDFCPRVYHLQCHVPTIHSKPEYI